MPTDKRARQKAARREKIEAQRRAEKRRRTLRTAGIVAVVAVVVVVSVYLLTGSNSSTSTTTTTVHGPTTTTTTVPSVTQKQADALAVAAGCPKSTSARVNTLSWSAAPALTIDKTKTYYANFVTTAGAFRVKFDAAKAPETVNSFIFLAKQGYYHCVIFHRVIPGFVVQGGDPTGTGTGGPGYTIPDELPSAASPTYPLYSLAMANTGQPHTGGSQFFIVTGPNGESLPASYSLFGQVVSGTKTVDILNAAGSTSGVPPTVTHRILSVTITQ